MLSLLNVADTGFIDEKYILKTLEIELVFILKTILVQSPLSGSVMLLTTIWTILQNTRVN